MVYLPGGAGSSSSSNGSSSNKPKKKKKKDISFSPLNPFGPSRPSGSSSSGSSSSGTPQQAPRPSYLTIPKAKPAKPQPTFQDFLSTLKENIAGSTGELADKRPDLSNFLKQVADPTAPAGYLLDVPKKFRSDAWNKKQIASELADATDSKDYNYALNNILERQFTDREHYIIGGGDTEGANNSGILYRKSDRIKKVLERAEQGLYDGNFDVLRKELEKHPDLLKTRSFKADFGVTPEQVFEQWEKDRVNLSPEERDAGRYRVDMMRRHLTKIRESYNKTNKFVNDAITQYETKYNDQLKKYENWSGEDADKNKEIAKKAGPAIPDLTPPTPKDEQYILDQSAGRYDDGFVKLLGGRPKDIEDKFKVERSEAKKRLKIAKLPSIKEMLQVKVQEGNLDPKDQQAVETWIDRFKNPNHPETRAMYAAFAKQFGTEDSKKVSDDDILKYINEPVEKYLKNKTAQDKANAERTYKKNEKEDKSKFSWSDLNDFDDHLKSIGGLEVGGYKSDSATIDDVDPLISLKASDTSAGVDFDASNTMERIMDILSRPLYGVAGAANSLYSMDQDQSTPWHGQDGFLGTVLSGITDPVSLLTGQSWIDSVDEITKDYRKIADPFKSAYQQTFRGLPGAKDNIVPITFSQVIANNAARDPENNIYDKSWYQHTAGFVMDLGADPLNLIGVGVVDDVVKIPARLLKGRLADEAVEGPLRRSLDGMDVEQFYDAHRKEYSSPTAEHVYRTRKAIEDGDVTRGYESDRDLFGKDVSSPVGEPLIITRDDNVRQAMRQLVENQHRAIADTANSHFDDVISEIDGGGSIAQRVDDTLRVNKLVSNLGNLGHNAKASVKALAKSKGFQNEYKRVGAETGVLKADVTRYLDEGGKLPNEFGGSHTAYREVVPNPEAIGGSYTPGPITKSLRTEYAKAMDYDPKAFPFSERDIYESLVNGTRLASSSDPVFKVRYTKAREILQNAVRSYKFKPTQYNKRAMDYALRNLQTDLYGASLRYLDALGEMRRSGAVFTDPETANKLASVRKDVRGRRDAYVSDDAPRNADENVYENYSKLTDEDLLDPANPVFTDRASAGLFEDEGRHLEQLDKTLTQRINALRLDKDGVLTGLPPREAYDVAQLIPEGLRKADGSIDAARLGAVFKWENDRVIYRLGDSAEAKDYHFAEIMRGAIEDEQRDLYIKLTDEARGKAVEAEGGPLPVGTDNVSKVGKKPEASDSIKPNMNSEWAKANPDGFSSRHDLMETALQSEDDFYDALFASGAPFKFDVYRRLPFKGKSIGKDYPSSIRKDAMELGSRAEVDEYMRELARVNYAHMIENQTNITEVRPHMQGDKSSHRLNYEHNNPRISKDNTVSSKQISGIGTKELVKKFSDTWNRTVKARQAEWQKKYNKASALDKRNAVNRNKGRGQVSNAQKAEIKTKSFEDAKAAVVKSVVDNQKVPRGSGNERLTINETARAATKEIKQEYQLKKADLQMKIDEATDPDTIKSLQSELKGLDVALADATKTIERGRTEAIATKKAMTKRTDEDFILQVGGAPTHMTTKAIQLRILGMRKNFQLPNNLTGAMPLLEKLLPATTYANFANNYIRPTKLLTTQEAITFRAMYTSQTPVIIHAHLSSMSHAMGKVSEANRGAMFEAMRRGRAYEGPQSEFYPAVKSQLDDIEKIFQGKHDFYTYWDSQHNAKVLSLKDINAYLPNEYKIDLDALYKLKTKNKGELTLDHVFETMGAKADKIDPFRFAWVTRLAADQARQTKAIHHLMRETFGVQRIGKLQWDKQKGKQVFRVDRSDPKARVIEKLQGLGWQPVEGLDPTHLFPPEALNDVKQLLKFMDPATDKAGIMKQFDTILGYWKQGATIYNPGYYTRNGIGEIMSSWLDGVNNPKYYRHSMKVVRYLKKTDQDLAQLMEQWAIPGTVPKVSKGNEAIVTLKGGQKVSVEEILQEYLGNGLGSTFANTDIGQGLRGLASEGLAEGKISKTVKGINNSVHAAGEGFEDWLRMAHFIHAMEHSGKTTVKAAAVHAAEKVRKYHFDYTDFSKMEQTVMLRAFPFYKWTRRGAPLMLAHLFMTPGKMTVLPKTMDYLSGMGIDPSQTMPWNWNDDDPVLSTQDVYEDKNGFLPDYRGIAPAWVRDLFAYEMNPTEDDEYANYFRVQTPMIDGLNALTDMVDHPLDPRQWDTARGLLNPLLKAGMELPFNQQVDPENNYQIMGGQYNEMNQINPLESLAIYAGKTLNPWTGFLAKLSKNGDLGKLSMGVGGYRDEHGYEKSKDIASFMTGLGFYQGMPGSEKPKGSDTENPAPVGEQDLSKLPRFQGVSPAQAPKKTETGPVESAINSIIQGGGLPTGGNSYSGSGWQNFGYGGGRGWRNFGGGYSSGGRSGFDLLAFLRQLAQQLDQGQVYKGDLNND